MSQLLRRAWSVMLAGAHCYPWPASPGSRGARSRHGQTCNPEAAEAQLVDGYASVQVAERSRCGCESPASSRVAKG
jgi:hypothetical protein